MSRRMFAAFVTILALAALAPQAPAQAGPIDTWYWRSPRPTGNDLNGVAWGAGQYVAVGKNGVILTSPHGNVWTLRRSNFASSLRPSLNGVAWGNGRYVAVGNRCTILVSADGVTWRRRSSGYAGALYGVTWCLDRFLAVGRVDYLGKKVSAILSSPDGEAWEAVRLEDQLALRDVTYRNGLFIAVGDGGIVLTSADGAAWSAVSAPSSAVLYGVAYGAGQFVAVGAAGTVLTSSDGALWEAHPVGWIGNRALKGVAFGGGAEVFVAVAQGNTYGNALLYSLDGITWNAAGHPYNYWGYRGVAWGGDCFVAVSGFGRIDRSGTGVIWERRSPDPGPWLKDVAWGGGKFLAVGDVIMQSTDGRTWETTSQDSSFFKVTYGAGRFWACAYDGIHASPDGKSWSKVGGSLVAGDIEIHYGLFVALNYDFSSPVENAYYRGHVLISLDGYNWHEVFIGDWSEYPMSGSAWGNGVLVVAAGDRIYYSWDALTWFRAYGLGTSVAFGNGVFVAAGELGGYRSRDARTWERIADLYSTGARLGDIIFAHGQFVASGDDGPNHKPAVFSSPDGISWDRHPLSGTRGWEGWASGPDSLVAVGYEGAIIQSGRFGPP